MAAQSVITAPRVARPAPARWTVAASELRLLVESSARSHSGLAQVLRFGCVGLVSTVAHLGLFAVLQPEVGSQAANLIALVLATIGNTAANRRWTFGVTGRQSAAKQHLQSFVVFAAAWALSAGALWVLPHLWAHPTTAESTAAVAVSMVGSTGLRFVAMRTWIFRTRP